MESDTKARKEKMMEWNEYEYKKWGGGEWDRPVDGRLLMDIVNLFNLGRTCIIEDCLATPSGTRILGIANAYMWRGRPRILYWYKTKDGTAPGTAIIVWLDEDVHYPGPLNLTAEYLKDNNPGGAN